MKRIILTRGIPASGKSTWAKQEVLKDPEHSIRINRDETKLNEIIRTTIGQHPSETALDNAPFDYIIENNGTIADLIVNMREIMINEKLL